MKMTIIYIIIALLVLLEISTSVVKRKRSHLKFKGDLMGKRERCTKDNERGCCPDGKDCSGENTYPCCNTVAYKCERVGPGKWDNFCKYQYIAGKNKSK